MKVFTKEFEQELRWALDDDNTTLLVEMNEQLMVTLLAAFFIRELQDRSILREEVVNKWLNSYEESNEEVSAIVRNGRLYYFVARLVQASLQSPLE